MKKSILIVVAGFLLASCASGWSCKNRYCDAEHKPEDKIKTT